MPNYPTNIPALRTAILLYTPNVVAAQEPYNEALLSASIVSQSGDVFDALSPHVEALDVEGLKVLAGVSRALHQNSWLGKADAALAMLVAVLPLIPDPVGPVEP